jgi:uncharacterized protein YcfJ
MKDKISVAIVFSLLLFSCQKEYNCACTTINETSVTYSKTFFVQPVKGTARNAKKKCEVQSYTDSDTKKTCIIQ